MKNLQLLNTRIVARLITPDRSDGGIVLPQCAGNTAEHRLADVLHVGTKVQDVKPLQRVVLNFSGGWVKLDDELLIMTEEKNVLAVMEEVAE